MSEFDNKSLTSSKESVEYLVDKDVSWLYINMKKFTEAQFTQSTVFLPASFHATVLHDSSWPSSPRYLEKSKENNDVCQDGFSSLNTRSTTSRPRLPLEKKSEETVMLKNYSSKAYKNSDLVKPAKVCIPSAKSSAYVSTSHSHKPKQYNLNATAFHQHQNKAALKNYANENETKKKILNSQPPDHISSTPQSHEHKIIKDSRFISCYCGETMESYAKRWCSLSLKRLDLPASKSAQIVYLQTLIKPPLHKAHFQILESEKKRVRSELVAFDTNFSVCYGELPTSDQKKPLKPLYGYYRRLKLLLEQVEIYYKNNKKKHPKITK